FRTQAIVALAALAAAAIALAVTGPHLAHLYDTIVANCGAHGDCSTVTNAFVKNDRALQVGLDALVVVVPGIIGLFWGAPLVARELAAGTFRQAWTQSVTRGRWLTVKLGVVGLASMAVAGLFSLMASWWSSPLDRISMTLFGSFDQRDIVPIGYAAFAFALGVTAGVLIRRTLPAMATTLVIFVAARLAIRFWVRPNLIAPLRITMPDDTIIYNGTGSPPTGTPPGSWVLSDKIINGAGHVIGQNGVVGNGNNMTIGFGTKGVDISGVGACPDITPHLVHGASPANGPSHAGFDAAVQKCLAQLRIRDVVTYQPASRYWTLQWYELAIYLGLALILAGVCFWWVRRRVA
ncbi:MAG: hypothetical protein ACREOE_03315, partial [Gemmatimonadales bacterium]